MACKIINRKNHWRGSKMHFQVDLKLRKKLETLVGNRFAREFFKFSKKFRIYTRSVYKLIQNNRSTPCSKQPQTTLWQIKISLSKKNYCMISSIIPLYFWLGIWPVSHAEVVELFVWNVEVELNINRARTFSCIFVLDICNCSSGIFFLIFWFHTSNRHCHRVYGSKVWICWDIKLNFILRFNLNKFI